MPSDKIKITPQQILFALVLLLGLLARTWQFGTLPPGLNQDEASSGVDAFSLYRFGVDRNGVAYPVHFISWGSGQNALYAYVLMPFIALGGLTPLMVRLPMLLSGLATLVLLYFVAKRTWNEAFALLALFFLAISPWHILLSRWGLESNFLPFVFLLGYACLLKSRPDNHWFIGASVFFGLCLYAYGTAYLAVPIFLGCALPILWRSRRVSARDLLIGLAVLVVIGLPIGLFLWVNTLRLNSIELGFFTIPRLTSEPRYETLTAAFSFTPVRALTVNFLLLLQLLSRQSDGLIWNTIEPYGYFYRLTFPLALIGIVQLLASRKPGTAPERWLLLSWLAAALAVGIVQPANINRVNLIFIPLILCMALPLAALAERWRPAWVLVAGVFLIAFLAFCRDYSGAQYREQANAKFFAGLAPALEFARQTASPSDSICVSGEINMPYIFVLFVEQMNPREYLQQIEYLDPEAPFREVRSLGRYSFGLANCPLDRRTIYVLDVELPPDFTISYTVRSFGNYQVYLP